MPTNKDPTLPLQRFGGAWTEVKLDAISDYLGFFTSALKNQSFVLWYVDAFAGSGERTTQRVAGGLFEGRPVEIETVQVDGSAKRALAIEPRFSRLVFVEQHAGRYAALKELADANPDRNIDCRSGDANRELTTLFQASPWAEQIKGAGVHRAVVFLDPFNMAVKWSTLRLLADTAAVDVWYLFPLRAVLRQLARDFDAVDRNKQAALDEIFGTPDWREELYAQREEYDLLDYDAGQKRRTANKQQIEKYAKLRLQTIFCYVSDPLPLLTDQKAQLFSLFCASANPRAQALIKKGVSHVLKKYGSASRQRFSP